MWLQEEPQAEPLHSDDIREIVLQASELYRETEDDPMEYMKKLLELNKEDNDN